MPDSDRPFFSVVIPTKNRSQIIGYAVESVLRQSFGDFELVVVDNDDTPQTEQAMQRYASDRRVRRVRTGGLSMPDNWEAAFAGARGRYVALLEDKMAMKAHALATVRPLVERGAHEVVCWPLDVLYNQGPVPLVDRAPAGDDLRSVPSEEVLQRFLSTDFMQWASFMPLGYNCCVSSDLLGRIRSGLSGRVCPPAAPDYTLGFQLLRYADHVLWTSDALTVMSARGSNGVSLMRKTDTGKQFVRELGGAGVLYDNVPVQVISNSNLVCNDYVRLRRQLGGRLEKFPLNLARYFAQCYWDIAFAGRYLNVEMAGELQAWKDALSEQTPEVRDEVASGLPAVKFDILLRRLKLVSLWHVLRQFPRRVLFADVLEYVRWEEHPRLTAFIPEIRHVLSLRKRPADARAAQGPPSRKAT